MLYIFGFQRVAVAVSDLFFIDPEPGVNQEGAERGVRLEVRLLDRGDLRGSIYSAQPIGLDLPVWRVDMLESVDSAPGSFDRTHHHPVFTGWNPGRRTFEPALSADPLGFLAERLADLPGLLAAGGFDASVAGPADADDLRAAVPEILDATRRLLGRVHAGELGVAPDDPAELVSARVGWL